MQQTDSGLILPDRALVHPGRRDEVLPESAPPSGEAIDKAMAAIMASPVVKAQEKKVRKAYAKLQEAIRYEAERLAREEDAT